MCWLTALNIALHWLPTTRFFISRAPNMITTSEVELQPLNWLPALALSPTYNHVLAPCPQYSPTLAPNNSVLHLKGSKHDNHIGSRIATPALAPYPGSLHRLSASGSTSRGSHKKDINKTQIEFKIVFFQHIIL